MTRTKCASSACAVDRARTRSLRAAATSDAAAAAFWTGLAAGFEFWYE